MPSSLYLVIKTQTKKDTKPDYEIDDIIPHGYNSSLPSQTAERKTVYNYHNVGKVEHVTQNVAEYFDIKLRWAHDPFPSPSVVAYSSEKADASKLMDKEVNKFMEQEGTKTLISMKYDEDCNLVFVYGLKTKDGENVCFELFKVEIRSMKVYDSRLEPTAIEKGKGWQYDGGENLPREMVAEEENEREFEDGE